MKGMVLLRVADMGRTKVSLAGRRVMVWNVKAIPRLLGNVQDWFRKTGLEKS